MTNEEMILQTLGTNESAKTTLANILTEYFPSVVSEISLPDRIVEKFYDWQFPFIYTDDGAGNRKWSVSVRALCERNPKLADLDTFFQSSGTDGTFQETLGGSDTETNTDNSARRTKTEFNGVGDPTSQSTSDSVVVEPVEGRNTTERKTEYGKTRTYADGRTWSQILADVMDTRGPVYLFINSFAQILREPADDPCELPAFPPSMQLRVNTETIPADQPATASVTNEGTAYNAIFDLLLKIPVTGGLCQTKALTASSISSPMAIPNAALNRKATVGESFVLFATRSTDNKTFMIPVTVESVGGSVNPNTFINFSDMVEINGKDGANGEDGRQGEPGEPGPRGPVGETGLEYLFYANITNIGKVPAAGDGFSTSSAFFNRTPVVNDRFIGVFKYGVQSFIGTCRVDVAGHAVISLVVETTGAPGSGGGSGIYKHYITDAEGCTATIFTNNADVLTEWPTDDAGIIVVSIGHVENSDGLGNLLFLDTGDPIAPKYVYTTEDGSVRAAHFVDVASDEVTVV